MILRFSHLVWCTKSEHTFKSLTFSETKKANHHYCQSKEVCKKNLMRHLGCWIIYMQNDCFIFCLFLAALKCWSICSKTKSTFTKTTLFHSGMSIEISSFQSMFCGSEMLQHVKVQNRYNDCASSRKPNSRLTILYVG